MNKMSKAFHLEPMPDPVTLRLHPKEKVWYPVRKSDDKELFICGKGCIKITKTWKTATIQPFSNPYTAEEVKNVADEYGLNAVMGMIGGWGACSLFSDNSYGLRSVQYEVANMATLGKAYDDFTDIVQVIGDKFIDGLLKKNFTLQGTREKGSLWYDYKSSNDYGSLVGFTGIYEKVKLHHLQYVEHSIGPSFLGCRVLPMFDPIGFDNMLTTLFYYKYYTEDRKKYEKMIDKYVSVHDRIEHLTTKGIADSFHKIFEAQKDLTSTE